MSAEPIVDTAIAAKVAQYDCSIAAWEAADCGTEEGFQAASEASLDCF